MSSGGGVTPAWSRGGDELYFLDGDTMMAARVVTTPTFSVVRPEKLFTGHIYSGSGGRPYDVSANGRFLMVKGDGDNTVQESIVVIANWLSELRDVQNRQ